MGFLKVFVAVITISLIQGLVSANSFQKFQAALKVPAFEKAEKLTSLQTRDLSECTSDVYDLLTQFKSLLSTFPQAGDFVSNLEAQLEQCTQGAGIAASTCFTNIISEILVDSQTIQTEVFTASAAIAADIPKLLGCMPTSTSPAPPVS